MSSPGPEYQQSWLECQRFFERVLPHDPLFVVPLRVIDWAVAHGLNGWTLAWRSHDWLVMSNRRWQAKRADRLVVIPKPDLIELHLYRDGDLVRRVDTDQTQLDEELDRLMVKFRQASEF
jgi:hypothetical protein